MWHRRDQIMPVVPGKDRCESELTPLASQTAACGPFFFIFLISSSISSSNLSRLQLKFAWVKKFADQLLVLKCSWPRFNSVLQFFSVLFNSIGAAYCQFMDMMFPGRSDDFEWLIGNILQWNWAKHKLKKRNTHSFKAPPCCITVLSCCRLKQHRHVLLSIYFRFLTRLLWLSQVPIRSQGIELLKKCTEAFFRCTSACAWTNSSH